MKKFLNKMTMKRRQRGFGMGEVSLAVFVGIFVLIGGYLLLGQVMATLEVGDKTRNAMSVSAETRSYYRTASGFGTSNDEDLKPNIQGASSLPDSYFENLEITGGGAAADNQTFDLVFSNLDDKVCSRLEVADLGHNPDPGAGHADAAAAFADGNGFAECSSGVLTVTYLR